MGERALQIFLQSSLSPDDAWVDYQQISLFFLVIQGSSFQMPEGSEGATRPLEPICMPVTQGDKLIITAQTCDSVN